MPRTTQTARLTMERPTPAKRQKTLTEDQRKFEQTYEAIEAKFLDLGYVRSDISRIRKMDPVRQIATLTESIWNEIRPVLEPVVQDCKEARLKKERKNIIWDRTRLAEKIYTEYKKTLVPSQWRYFPVLSQVLDLPAFSTVMNAPNDVNVMAKHFSEAAEALPGCVASWIATLKAELAQLADDARTSGSGPSGTQDGQGQSPSPNTQSLELATAVFTSCLDDSVLLGWDGVAAHHCRAPGFNWPDNPSIEDTPAIVEFSPPASSAAASLVVLAGLDAAQATSAEMDSLDLRFLCIMCPAQKCMKQRSYKAFSWRAAVAHSIRHAAPTWRKLTNAESQRLRADEERRKANELFDFNREWSCNHCPLHLDNCQTLTVVTEHVKTVHAITNPTAPRDLFCSLDSTLERPISFLAPAIQFYCKRCPDVGAKGRLFGNPDGLISHLRDSKHHVLKPIVGQDWAWEETAQCT
ncbi:hypothetical protein FB451DRAFT_1303509 [Mycena latifolia]|nr:hypothetical protein FB451DRAFT_1303509 [Mycena latifolia]